MGDTTQRDPDGDQDKGDHPSPRPVPGAVGLLGIPMALAAALPLTPDGSSFLRLVARAFNQEFMQGLVTLAGYGSPFFFGLSLCLASLGHRESSPGTTRCPRILRAITRMTLSLMHVQLVLAAGILVWQGIGRAPLALLGFSVVSGVHLAYHSALARAQSDDSSGGPSLRWMAQWGSLLIVGTSGWLRLQWFDGVRFGVAVDLMFVSAILIHWTTRRRNPGS